MAYVSKVREFAEACNGSLAEKPVELSKDEISFIRIMVNDELTELEEAKDIVEQADALVDAIYYLCDCAAKHGMNLDPLFEIVHRANMTKIVDGKIIRREDGKILKPEGWQDPKPILESEMERQSKLGSFN
jgi:predicted HAD superfamily Cof-like phosphohydrolase